MSDPVTKGEIEDVLSSIRRLVAADSARTGARPVQSAEPVARREGPEERAPGGGDEEASEEAPDRLVLTPSFRVSDEPDKVPDRAGEAADDAADDDGLPPEMLRLTRALAARKELGTREPDTPEQGAETEAQAAREGEDAEHSMRRSSIERTIAELEAAVTGQPDDWEPDGSEVRERETPDWDFAELGVDTFELETRQRRAPAAAENASEDPEEARGGPDPAQGSGTRGAPETPSGNEVEEDRDETDPSADMAAAWAEVRAFEERGGDAERPAGSPRGPTFGEREALYTGTYGDEEDAEPEPGAEPEVEAETELDLMADEPEHHETEFLDEEALRELVSEIVRQELQGALGERITRNVRKLVRREIYRILQSQDFE